MWKLVFALAAGCIEPIAEHTSEIGHVERDCIVPVPAGIARLDAPVSLEYADGSLWIWEQVERSDGSTIANAAARVTSDVCERGVELVPELLALSADERAANAARTDGRRLALVPHGGFVADGVGYLYYEHVLYGPGFFDAEVLGTGMCIVAPDARGATPCARMSTASGTILWTPQQRVLNRGGLVVHNSASPSRDAARLGKAEAFDGDLAIVAGCRRVAAFEDPCTLAGVPLAAVRDPRAYKVWNAFSGWVDPLVDASAIGNEAGEVTIAPFGDGFLATSLDIFQARVSVRRAKAATGNFDHANPVFDVLPPTTLFARGGREHRALRPDPNSIAVTYSTDAPAAPGLHLVTFHFLGDFE